jgi:hypothetical protein
MPGMGMPGMAGGNIAGATNPNDPNAMADYFQKMKDMERAQKQFQEYSDAKQKGIIPSAVRRAFQLEQLDKGMNFYKRRSLRVEIRTDVDKLSEFLLKLEFGDRVSTINTMSVFADTGKKASESAGQKDLLRANISYDVHTMERPPEFPEFEVGTAQAESSAG